ncbi:hypothetical protein M404DRAFT_605526 [Pisolithus tinctorius Marx 270]|uniref:Uncharacterized protein n=1 Tax=Pisolithus tinctorius Marx 270 TaxID=870435 RepID=A0A0C3NAT4_PISTI|nr:hypothetical protein M404DRAFT_605526 [Pisolithus tinctorius Marx 270]
MVLQPIAAVYQYILAPVAPFAWFGLKTSTLDLLATVRLCLALRQIREGLRREYLKRASGKKLEDTIAAVENRSFVRDALTTLVVVYGGEAMICPYISVPASFMLSGATPLLCVVTQALVESIPAFMIPIPSFNTELPFSIFDAYNRAFLLCSIVPPVVLSSPAAGASGSPWALVLSSLVLANGGFFLANLFSLLQPTPLAVSTPPELLPYGWTATDLWSAPLVAALYATLTHTQPFWADVHAVLVGLVGGAVDAEGLAKVEPLDAETARAACALVLTGLFVTRTARTFGVSFKNGITEKIKTN